MSKGWMPRYLSAPPIILFWDANFIMPILLVFLLGVFLENVMLALVLIAVWIILHKQAKRHLPQGFTSNLMHMLHVRPVKGYPSFLENNFRE